MIVITENLGTHVTPAMRCHPVREGGLEPPRPCGHWNLNPARLPFRHSRVAPVVRASTGYRVPPD